MATETETKIARLFAAIDAKTATLSTGDAHDYLQIQIDAWERRERDLLAWAQAGGKGSHPVPGLDAFAIAAIILDLVTRQGRIAAPAAAA